MDDYLDDYLGRADEKLDAQGLLCPEPLMLLRNRLREVTGGYKIFVVATDPSTERDFSNLCRFMGHTMVAQRDRNGLFEFVIEKKC